MIEADRSAKQILSAILLPNRSNTSISIRFVGFQNSTLGFLVGKKNDLGLIDCEGASPTLIQWKKAQGVRSDITCVVLKLLLRN